MQAGIRRLSAELPTGFGVLRVRGRLRIDLGVLPSSGASSGPASERSSGVRRVQLSPGFRSRGERSRLQLLLKLGGTENMSILAVNVLAVNFWLLTVPPHL